MRRHRTHDTLYVCSDNEQLNVRTTNRRKQLHNEQNISHEMGLPPPSPRKYLFKPHIQFGTRGQRFNSYSYCVCVTTENGIMLEPDVQHVGST